MRNGLDVTLFVLGCTLFVCVLGASVLSLLWGIVVPLDIRDNRVLLALLTSGCLLVALSRR